MTSKYEVANRYSAYLEARRLYLDEESEEEIESEKEEDEAYYFTRRSVISTSSDSEKKEPEVKTTMVLVPTVTVQEIEVPSPESELPTSNSNSNSEVLSLIPTTIEEEIKGEQQPEPEEDPSLEEKLENLKRQISEKYGEIKEQIWNLRNAEVPEELKYIWNVLVFLFVGICTIFTFVAFIRAIFFPTPIPDEGWFCRYFAGPFSPIFNALCEKDPVFFAHRVPLEMSLLADQLGHGISQFFDTLASGFTVFGTLFSAIWIGITDNLSFGCHELGENLGENVSYLIHFVVQIIQLIFNLIFSAIANVADIIAQGATVIHDHFQPPEPTLW